MAEGVPDVPSPIRSGLVRPLILEAYRAVIEKEIPADQAVETVLRREKRLFARERRAVADAVHDWIRRTLTVDALLRQGLGDAALLALPADNKALLSYAGWRVLAGEDPAAVQHDLNLPAGWSGGLAACAAGRSLLGRDAPAALPGERASGDAPKGPSTATIALSTGFPDWLVQRWVGDLGAAEAAALAHSLNARAPLTVRANRLLGDRAALAARLEAEGVRTEPALLAPDGLHLLDRVNVHTLPSFRDGWFEVQDEGSQLIARLVGARPGWTIADACAGAGGKTLALAAEMSGRGLLVACDADVRRLSRLAPRARRARVQNVELCPVPAERLPRALLSRLAGACDAVLVDAPCSGTGVLRRHPDLRLRLRPAGVKELQERQIRLLARFSALVKPGGRLVYATCSLLRDENEAVVAAFRRARPDFTVEPVPPLTDADGCMRLYPHRQGTDGFFACRLVLA